MALGPIGAFGLGRAISSQLYGVAPYDTVVLIAVIVPMLAAAVLASWLPARRAAGVDPMHALRRVSRLSGRRCVEIERRVFVDLARFGDG